MAVTGAVDAVVANEHGVIAIQAGTVFWVSPQGDVIRRPVPSRALEGTADEGGRRLAQAQADEDLFDRHGVEEDIRHEVEGEAWLEDMRPMRSAAGASGWLEGAGGVLLLAANAKTGFVASDAGLFELPTPGVLKPRITWTQQPLAMAVSAGGRVAFATALGVSVLGANAQSSVCTPTMGPAEQLAVFEGSAGISRKGVCAQTTLLWRQGSTVTVATDAGLFVLPWRATSLVSCGNFALVNADEGLFLLRPSWQPAQPVSWQLVASQAPHQHLRCTAHVPWAVAAFDDAGGGAAVSVDGGRNWRPLVVPAGMPLTDIAIWETGPWLATPWGLGQPGMTTPAPTRRNAVPASRAPAALWAQWLPLVDVTAGWGLRTQSRTDGVLLASQEPTRDTSVLLTAEFPLSPSPRQAAYNSNAPPPATLAQVAAPQDAASNVPAPQPTPGTTEVRPMPPPRPPPPKPHRVPAGPPACLADLREAAVAMAMAHPQRLQSLVARARYAAWLPELRFRAEKRLGRNQSLDFDSDTIFAPLGVRTVNDMRLEVRASWDLSRVVYSPDELAATVQAARIADARREVSVLVNRLFFERRRREAALADENGEAEGEDDLEDAPTSRRRLRSTTNLLPLRTAELSADLDALTGGLAATCR